MARVESAGLAELVAQVAPEAAEVSATMLLTKMRSVTMQVALDLGAAPLPCRLTAALAVETASAIGACLPVVDSVRAAARSAVVGLAETPPDPPVRAAVPVWEAEASAAAVAAAAACALEAEEAAAVEDAGDKNENNI